MSNNLPADVQSAALERAGLNAANDTQGVLQAIVTDPLRFAREKEVAYNNTRRNVTVRECLDSKSRQFLQTQCYPHLNLVFEATSSNAHGLAAARRSIEQERMIAKCNRFSPVVDVGGNFFYWLSTGRMNVHSCCPICDVRDGKRFTDRVYNVRKWVDAAYHQLAIADGPKEKRKAQLRVDQAAHFINFPGDHYCTDRAQDCSYQAAVCLFGDSLYDIPVGEVAVIMAKHGAMKGYGNITFDPEMLINKSGFIPGMNCHWKRETRRNHLRVAGVPLRDYEQEIIRFTYEDDSSFEYIHDYQNLVRLATQTVFRCDGHCYVVERNLNNGILSFDMSEVHAVEAPCELSFSFWRDTTKGKVAVTIYDYDGVGTSGKASDISWEIALIEQSLVEKVLNYGLRLDGETKFTPAAMFSYCSAVNVRGTINGVEISVSESEHTVKAYKLCFALWFVCFLEKYRMANVMEFLVKRELRLRTVKNASAVRVLYWMLTGGGFSQFFSDQSFVTRKIDEVRTAVAKAEKEKWSVPEPAVSVPEPLVRFSEVVEAVNLSVLPSFGDLGYYQSLVDSYEREVEPTAVRSALTELSRQLRCMDRQDPEYRQLANTINALSRRLAVLDPTMFENLDKSWSLSEDAERLLDLKVELPGGTVGNARALSGLGSPTPSESASNIPVATQEYPSVGGSVEQSKTSDSQLFEDEVARVKLPKPSDQENNSVTLTGVLPVWGKEVAEQLVQKGLKHLEVSGKDAMCGVRALLHSVRKYEPDTTFGIVNAGLVVASGGLRGDWFELSDIVAFLATKGMSLMLLRFRHDGREAEVHTFGDGKRVCLLAHVNGVHWQPFEVGGEIAVLDRTSRIVGGADFSPPSSPVRSFLDFVTEGVSFDDVSSVTLTPTLDAEKKGAQKGVKTRKPMKGSSGLFRNPCVLGKSTAKTSTNRDHVAAVPGNSDFGDTDDRSKVSQILKLYAKRKLWTVKSAKRALCIAVVGFSPIALSTFVSSGGLSLLLGAVFEGFALAVSVSSKLILFAVSSTGLTVAFPLTAAVTSPYWLPPLERVIESHGLLFVLPALPVLAVRSIFDFIRFSLRLPAGFFRLLSTIGKGIYSSAVTVDKAVIGALTPSNAPVLADDQRIPINTPRLPVSGEYVNGRMTLSARLATMLKEVSTYDDERVKEFVKKVTAGGTPSVKPVSIVPPAPQATLAQPEMSRTAVDSEQSKPGLLRLGRVDAERREKDRTAWYVTYLDYLKKSVDAYTAYCCDLYQDYLDKGEIDFYKKGNKRHHRTDGAIVLDAIEPGKFRLPEGYLLPSDPRLSCVYVPETKTRGSLVGAKYSPTDRTILTDGRHDKIFLILGMFEYLDKLTLDMVVRKKIARVEPRRNFKLVDGVPGCAKSTEVTEIAKPGDLVAVATRGAATELQEKFVKAGKNPAVVRTIGSRIIGRPETCTRLLVDEGLKVHPGELVLLAEVTGASEVLVFGDRNQLEFKPRVAGYSLPEIPMHWSVEYRTKSYTVCRDVVVALGRLAWGKKGGDCDGKGIYPHGFTTTNKVEKSLGVCQIASEAEVPKIPGAKYITWTQSSKEKLLRKGFKNVNTIDEFQGGRADVVVLVRLERNLEPGLRFDKGQMTVALTRHKEQLVYATVEQPPALQDYVKEMIDRVSRIDDINAVYGAYSGNEALTA